MKPTFYLLLFAFLFIASCKGGSIGESLLSSGDFSCNNEISQCDSSTSPSDPNALSVQAVSNDMTLNMDQSDILEITGSCSDQGKKKNRILVEVFAGDQDETATPYINNSIMSNCYSMLGTGVTTSSGLTSGQKCFWVTKGKGLIEDTGLPSQKDFPQCHNGQFGFAIKLGKILTDNTLGTKYLVRYKIRTEEGSIVDSPWNRVAVTRKLSTPKIESAVPSSTLSFACELKTNVARFNQNISYTLNRSYNYLPPATGASTPLPLVAFTDQTTVNSLLFEPKDFDMVEGVTYNYSLIATEKQYAALYAPNPNPTATSPSVTCELPKPEMYKWLGDNSATGSCYLALNKTNHTSRVKYYIARNSTANWTRDNPASGIPQTCQPNGGPVTLKDGNCEIRGLLPSKAFHHYIAARAYYDANSNDFPDANEEVGKWSNEVDCFP